MEWIQVHGTSMSPFLSPGDSVGVQWWPEDEVDLTTIQAGEIVIARGNAGDWVVHRIVSPGRARLKGDASPVADDAIEPEVWGRVVAVRMGGRERTLRTSPLDRWIAFFSGLRLLGKRYMPISLAGVHCLGRIRRALVEGAVH